jgi:hypothetical protein
MKELSDFVAFDIQKGMVGSRAGHGSHTHR